MKEPQLYAEVAVALPLRNTFHYRIPKHLQEQAAVGKRVRVSFGHQHLLGTLVGMVEHPPLKQLKTIDEILDDQPLLDLQMLELTRWMAEIYQAGWGETLAAALPGPLRRGLKGMRPREEEPLQAPTPNPPLRLTTEQQKALEPVVESIRDCRHAAFLLHGVTGSGKTEVYLQAIQEVLSQDRSSIMLVPEISLTPQTIERFQGRFGRETVAVLHSGMLESRRLQEWQRIRSGEAKVVVGARSAIFAPARNLGLIVIDEEHEPSYKQEDAPRYHAREVAIQRGKLCGAAVLLGSATPSLETYYRATSESSIHLLRLQERIDEVPLPKVQVVDMRQELAAGRRSRIFSRPLEDALAETLKGQQQGILFLNRRGFATLVHCRKCGHVLRCKSCQISLIYHMATKSMLCHSCKVSVSAPEICPQCRSDYVRFQGIGTERVESELARLFPKAAIERMDTDATKVRGSHARILGAFSEHKIDLLVGTQMIAKGLDFPRVTLVGVISADTALNLPDFRSAERTFNLLTQVAGRAGRGRMPGRVIVQTYTPHHYAIQAAKEHDYLSFYRQEIAIRRQLFLPPFARLIRLMVRSPRESRASAAAEQLAAICRQHLAPSIQVVGPAPAAIPRLRRQYRWQLLLKASTLEPLQQGLPEILQQFHRPNGCYLTVDVDPL